MAHEIKLAALTLAIPFTALGFAYPVETDALAKFVGYAIYEELPTLTPLQSIALGAGLATATLGIGWLVTRPFFFSSTRYYN